MKKWILLGFLVWGAAGGVRAQDIAASNAADGGSVGNADGTMASPNTFHDFLGAAAGSAPLRELGGGTLAAPKFAGTNLAAPVASAAMAAPAPQVIYRGTENDRLSLIHI